MPKMIYFGHREYYRISPHDGVAWNEEDADQQFGYVFGRDAIVSPAPEIYGQEFLNNDFAVSYNVFFLPTASQIERFGKKIRLSAGWWASVIPPFDDAKWRRGEDYGWVLPDGRVWRRNEGLK